uniref:Phosphorylcholine transferase LicD n=1 Tax=Prevotella sp. GTC17259 TaxID=3236795 RepID=A0AB33JC82_9BACT
MNLDSEYREGYLVSAEMKKVWAVELDLLKKLVDICKKHDLRVWIEGGTLLGAVRHQGFIPWDDDIDVSMPRPDYEKLKLICAEELEAPYFLQTAYNDEHYCCGHAQLRNSNTTGVRPSDCYRPYNQGIFIDIFILDGIPDDMAERKQLFKEVHRRLCRLKSIDYPILISGRLGLLFRKWWWRRKVSKYGFANLYKYVDDLLLQHSWENSQRVGYVCFGNENFVWDKHIYDHTAMLSFEGMQVPAPAGYDVYLKQVYGPNYMTPVQCPNMHGTVVFDTERCYRERMPEIRRAYRRSAMRRLWLKIKKCKSK